MKRSGFTSRPRSSAARVMRSRVLLLAVVAALVVAMHPASAGAATMMTYSGGPVMGTSTTYAIFWLPSDHHFEPTGDDARYENRIRSFLSDVGGTSYYNALSEYSTLNGNVVKGGPIQNSSTFGGSAVDTTPYPHAGTTQDPLTTADFQAAISRAIASNGWTAGSTSLFFLYMADGVQTCDLRPDLKSGRQTHACTFESPTSYPWCGGHSSFTQGSSPVIYAVVPDVITTCSLDPAVSPSGDWRADGAVTESSNLLADAVTDPIGNAWTFGLDAGGDASDFCRPATAFSLGSTMQLHANTYRVGPIWSNASQECVTSNPPAPAARNIAYEGGSVMPTTTTYAIFWLPDGAHYEAPSITGGDAHYESVIDSFFKDVGGTPYYNILTQYSKDALGRTVANGPIQNTSTFGGAYVDTTPYPRAGTDSDPLLDTDVQNEVERAMQANGWTPGLDKLYFVFVAQAVEECFPGLQTGCLFYNFCAYHYHTTVREQPLIYAFEPSAYYQGSCGSDTLAAVSPHNDAYADSETMVISHELFESVSDPLTDGWLTSQGEIGDVCAFVTGSGAVSKDGGDITLHGHRYLVQNIWSNATQKCALRYPARPKAPKCANGYKRVKVKGKLTCKKAKTSA